MWLIHDRSNTKIGGKLVPPGEPFEAPKELAESLLDRGYSKLTAAQARKILAGEPEVEDELEDEGGDA